MKFQLHINTILSFCRTVGCIIRKKRWVNLSFRIAFIVFALYIVFKSVSFNQLATTMSEIRMAYLLPAIFLFILSKIFSSIRLNMYFRDTGIILSDLLNMKLYLVGMFYNFFLPGGIGGDGYKIYWLRKNKAINPAISFKVVLTDRLNGVIALIILSIILALVIHAPSDLKYTVIVSSLCLLIILILVTCLYYKTTPALFINLVLVSLGVQFFQLLSVLFILVAFGVNTGVFPYLWLFLISSVIAMLPFSIGGLGSRELAFLAGSKYLFLNSHLALSLSLVFYFISLMVSFTGIYLIFNKKF